MGKGNGEAEMEKHSGESGEIEENEKTGIGEARKKTKYRNLGAEDVELYRTCRIYGKSMHIPVVSGAAGYGKAGFWGKRGCSDILFPGMSGGS